MRRIMIPVLIALLAPLSAGAISPTLTVTPQTPAISGSVPQGAQRVPMLTVKMQASCAADIPVTSLTLMHGGLGDAADILRVYALSGIQRVTRVASVSARNPTILRLPASFSVPACQSTTLTIVTDFSGGAATGGEHRLDLVSVVAAATTTILPSAATPRLPLSVTPHPSQPTITADFRPVTETQYYGANRLVARLLLTAGAGADQQISAITFFNDGTARDSDMQNLYLETASHVRVSDVAAHMDGRTVRITLNPPLLLERNDSKLLNLRADIRASRTHTIRWTIESPSDIEAGEWRGR